MNSFEQQSGNLLIILAAFVSIISIALLGVAKQINLASKLICDLQNITRTAPQYSALRHLPPSVT
jgi:hypothetical protein